MLLANSTSCVRLLKIPEIMAAVSRTDMQVANLYLFSGINTLEKYICSMIERLVLGLKRY